MNLSWSEIAFAVDGTTYYLHWTTLLLVLLMFYFSQFYFKRYLRTHVLSRRQRFMLGSTLSVVSILSIVGHEYAHAWAASLFQIPIIESGIHGAGAYVRPEGDFFNFPAYQKILIALCGGLFNLIVGLAAMLYVRLYPDSVLETSVESIGYINLNMARFNLLYPVLLLDGGKVWEGVLTYVIPDTDFRLTVMLVISGITVVYYLFLRGRLRGKVLEWEDRIDVPTHLAVGDLTANFRGYEGRMVQFCARPSHVLSPSSGDGVKRHFLYTFGNTASRYGSVTISLKYQLDVDREYYVTGWCHNVEGRISLDVYEVRARPGFFMFVPAFLRSFYS